MATQIPPAIAKIAPDGNLTPRQVRRFMINMAMRNGKPGTGSGHEFMQRRTATIPWPDFRPILQGVDWVIVGDVATRAYMPERVTKDLDILVHKDDEEVVIAKLEKAGYRTKSRLAIPGYLMLSPEGVEVDVLFGDYPWLKNALAHPSKDPAGYPVIGMPYLVLLKITAQRAQDWADASRIVGWASDGELDAVRAVVARYSPEDSEDLESLIFISKKEQEFPPDSKEE